MASMAAASSEVERALAPDKELLVRICCTCRKEKKVRAAGKGKDQSRCVDCNITRNKLYRLSCNDIELANGIQGFTQEERQELYEDAEGLMGDKLKKVVTHAICISQSRKMARNLERILAKAGQAEWDTIMKCTEIINEAMICTEIPQQEDTMNIEIPQQEDTMNIEKKRRIEGEETVRPKAKAKGTAKAKEKALSCSVKTRLVKSIPKLQGVLTSLATVVAIQDTLDEQLKALQKLHDEQVGEPPAIKAAFSKANAAQKDAIEIVKRLRVYMDDADEDEAEQVNGM